MRANAHIPIGDKDCKQPQLSNGNERFGGLATMRGLPLPPTAQIRTSCRVSEA